MNMYDRRGGDGIGGEQGKIEWGGVHNRWRACKSTQGIRSGIFAENKTEDRQEFESSQGMLEMTGCPKQRQKKTIV